VVNYLISKNIDPKRLRAKGYGETKFIAPNEKPNGSDDPEGRQRNRRTEFRIVGTIDKYSEIIYTE
jgi:outer membrane protein OmpA-like peptidoglycan-associated protein